MRHGARSCPALVVLPPPRWAASTAAETRDRPRTADGVDTYIKDLDRYRPRPTTAFASNCEDDALALTGLGLIEASSQRHRPAHPPFLRLDASGTEQDGRPVQPQPVRTASSAVLHRPTAIATAAAAAAAAAVATIDGPVRRSLRATLPRRLPARPTVRRRGGLRRRSSRPLRPVATAARSTGARRRRRVSPGRWVC